MPDFWPLIKANAGIIVPLFLFVGVVRLIVFVARRWRSNP